LALLLVMGVVAGGGECPYNSGEKTIDYYRITISDAKDLHEGDEVEINYTYHDNIAKTVTAVKGTPVHISGYRNGELIYSAVKFMGTDDEPIKFCPIAGEYIVQAGETYSQFTVLERREGEEEVVPIMLRASLDDGTGDPEADTEDPGEDEPGQGEGNSAGQTLDDFPPWATILLRIFLLAGGQ